MHYKIIFDAAAVRGGEKIYLMYFTFFIIIIVFVRLSDKISSVHKFSYYIFKFFLNLGANIRIIGDYLLYLPQVLRFIINVTNNETKQWLENEKVFFRRSRADGANGM